MIPAVPRPAVVPVNPEKIPASMREVNRWINWRWEWNPKKNELQGGWDKPPLNTRTGGKASSTNARTWTSFDLALAAHLRGDFDGVGFTFGFDQRTGLNWSGLDLDDHIIDGELTPVARWFAAVLDSYTEISPSGLGIKVFLIGTWPPGRCQDKPMGVELYDHGRYFTVTGRHLDWSPLIVNERSAAMATLFPSLLPTLPRIEAGREKLTDREIALSALWGLDSARAQGYAGWLAIGMMLHSVDQALLGEWDRWSKQSPSNYEEDVCERKWQSFKKQGVGIGSLIELARQDGWVHPYDRGRDRPETVHHRPSVSQESDLPPQTEAHANGRCHQDDDPNMGDGLTEQDGAGPWKIIIETGDPCRYLLRSPIWQDHPRLAGGFLPLSVKEIYYWRLIRQAAAIQAPGIYVPPDSAKKPVWDSRKGPRLLRRLFLFATEIQPSTDYDRILAAIEFIIDRGRRTAILTEEKRDAAQPRELMRFEDGSIVFKLRGIAAIAKKDAPGISLEDLREAATRYATEECLRFGTKRPRYYCLTSKAIDVVDDVILHRLNGNGKVPVPD